MKFIDRIKNHPIEYILLLAILIIAAFLFFFRIGDFLHFAGDEARDVFIVRGMVENADLISLGPAISVGAWHLGPAYYYILAPFSIISGYSPVGGAVMTALFALASVFLMYKVGRLYFSPEAGLFSALVYATSFLVILHARWPWNLNILPFFVLLMIYAFGVLLISKKKKRKSVWFIVFFASLGIAIQLHSTAFLLFLIFGILWLWLRPRVGWGWAYPIGIGAFFLVNIPMIFHELTSGFANTRGAILWLTSPRSGGFNIIEAAKENIRNFGSFFDAFWLNSRFFWVSAALILAFFVVVIVRAATNKTNQKELDGLKVLLVFLVAAFFTFPFLQEQMYSHYFIMLFPIAGLMLGYLAGSFWTMTVGKIVVIIGLGLFLFVNISGVYSYWKGLEKGTVSGEAAIPFKDIRSAVDYMTEDSEGREFKIDVYDKEYYRAFEYVLYDKGVELDENAKLKYMVETRSGADNKFGVLEVVPKRGY